MTWSSKKLFSIHYLVASTVLCLVIFFTFQTQLFKSLVPHPTHLLHSRAVRPPDRRGCWRRSCCSKRTQNTLDGSLWPSPSSSSEEGKFFRQKHFGEFGRIYRTFADVMVMILSGGPDDLQAVLKTRRMEIPVIGPDTCPRISHSDLIHAFPA